MNIVYVPKEGIWENIYRKRITSLQDVRTRDLKEVPAETIFECCRWFLNPNPDIIYNRELIKDATCYGDEDLDKTIEKIKTLMRAQYIKENSSEFESEAFLNGKREVFYVSKTPLGENDEKIGEVIACTWYDPIRAERLPEYVGSCLSQYPGDLGCFPTELDVEYAVWHKDLYYFF